MLRQTNYKGQLLKVGANTDVDSETAIRWVSRGIASHSETEEEETYGPVYASMKAKELYELCKERGITAETKQSAKYYIDLLIADDSKDDQVDLGADTTNTDEIVNTVDAVNTVDENEDDDSTKE